MTVPPNSFFKSNFLKKWHLYFLLLSGWVRDITFESGKPGVLYLGVKVSILWFRCSVGLALRKALQLIF